MREKCCLGVLAVMVLVAGGCGRQPIPEPPPPVDGTMVPASAAQVERPAAGLSVPARPIDAGVASAADPVPAAALPVAGPGGGIVVDKQNNVIDHGPMGIQPDSTDLRQLEREESLQTTKDLDAGIEPENGPTDGFLPGGP